MIERGCASCHEINGVKKPEILPRNSPPWAAVLWRKSFSRGESSILCRTISPRKIRNPLFGNALKMPQYTLAPIQVDALATALLAQTERAQFAGVFAGTRAQAFGLSSRGESWRADGRHVLLELPLIDGRGGDMAPNLTWEGTSVQRTWLVNFFKNPNTLRPALVRRMPKFNMTDLEANTLADYIMTVYQTPAFDRDVIDAARLNASEIERGRGLFYGKYGCQSCHIVDPVKDKGYIGPTLTQVGIRLNAAWIFHWLKNAQNLRPGSLEPVWNMPDNDAQAITAFLMAQKSTPRAGGAQK